MYMHRYVKLIELINYNEDNQSSATINSIATKGTKIRILIIHFFTVFYLTIEV